LEFDSKKIKSIEQYLKEIIGNNQKFISVNLIYNNKRATLSSLDIDNKQVLYSYLKAFYSDKYSFPFYPIICTKEYEKINKSEIMEQIFLEADSSLFYNEIKNKFYELGFSDKDVYVCINRNDNIVPLKKSHEYIHKTKLNFIDIKQLKKTIMHILKIKENVYIDIIKDVLNNKFDLPSLGKNIYWTKDLLAYFLKKINNFILLGTQERLILNKENDVNLKNEYDFLSYILNKKFNGYAELKEFSKLLANIGFISNDLPKSYQDENKMPYVIKGEEVIHKKLESEDK
jgi:hypothetical protein